MEKQWYTVTFQFEVRADTEDAAKVEAVRIAYEQLSQDFITAVEGFLEDDGYDEDEEEDEEGDEVTSCPACGGDGEKLGTLGNLVHFRCQNCGMDFNSKEGV